MTSPRYKRQVNPAGFPADLKELQLHHQAHFPGIWHHSREQVPPRVLLLKREKKKKTGSKTQHNRTESLPCAIRQEVTAQPRQLPAFRYDGTWHQCIPRPGLVHPWGLFPVCGSNRPEHATSEATPQSATFACMQMPGDRSCKGAPLGPNSPAPVPQGSSLPCTQAPEAQLAVVLSPH